MPVAMTPDGSVVAARIRRQGGSPALVYNSATVNVRPVVQLQLQSDPNTTNPPATQISVQLTWNGVQQNSQTFPINNYQAGSLYLFGVQVANAVTQSGVYNWSAQVTVTLSNLQTVTTSSSGTASVMVQDQSSYGAGWGIDGISRRTPSPSHTNNGRTNMSGERRVSRTIARIASVCRRRRSRRVSFSFECV